MEKVVLKLLEFKDINYNQVNDEGDKAFILAFKNKLEK